MSSERGWRKGGPYVEEGQQGQEDSELGMKNGANIGDDTAQDSIKATSSL